jgi:hypothetical protein
MNDAWASLLLDPALTVGSYPEVQIILTTTLIALLFEGLTGYANVIPLPARNP